MSLRVSHQLVKPCTSHTALYPSLPFVPAWVYSCFLVSSLCVSRSYTNSTGLSPATPTVYLCVRVPLKAVYSWSRFPVFCLSLWSSRYWFGTGWPLALDVAQVPWGCSRLWDISHNWHDTDSSGICIPLSASFLWSKLDKLAGYMVWNGLPPQRWIISVCAFCTTQE